MQTERIKKPIQLNQHENLANLLRANGQTLIHPRTRNLIVGTSLLTAQKPPNPYGKSHLCRIPRIPYEAQGNQTVKKGYRFVLNDTGIQAQKWSKTSQAWINVSSETVQYKKSSQYKTVWYSKHQRRQ